MYGEVGVINMNNQMISNQINQSTTSGINSSQTGTTKKDGAS